MAKWSGVIGFDEYQEIEPGLFRPSDGPIERHYKGDTYNLRISDQSQLSSRLSIIADPHAMENAFNARYAVIKGLKWKITNVDVNQSPRLIFEIGGKYNG